MKRRKSTSGPWSGPGGACRSYRTGSPLSGEPGYSGLRLLALRAALPASWRGCPQRSGCRAGKRDWKSLASDSSCPAGSGPSEQKRGLRSGVWLWSAGNKGEAAAGGSRLPLSTVRCPSGKHPGSTPGERDGADVRQERRRRKGFSVCEATLDVHFIQTRLLKHTP